MTQAYTYDLNGNRTRVVTASQTLTAAYDAQDRILNSGAATYVHAATGECTLKVVGTDTTRYRYDTFGNLRDVWLPSAQGGAHVQYEIDPQQRRTARMVNGLVTQRWLYQSQLAIAAEVDSLGNPLRTYVYGAHGNVPELMTTPSGQVYRFVTDQLGSVRLVRDATADTVVQRLDYDAYGRVVRDTKPGFQPFGYAGGVYEPLTGLVRFGARDYDAETGRWTAKDPAGLKAGLNTYEYAAGQPNDARDPSGLSPTWSDAANFVAGFGDGLTVGATRWIRRVIDADGVVSYCSGWYRAGGFAADATLIAAPAFAALDAFAAARAVAGAATAEAETAAAIGFRSAHAARHLVETGLSSTEVEAAIRAEIRTQIEGASMTGSWYGRVPVNGVTIEYRAYTLPSGQINVGTYYRP